MSKLDYEVVSVFSDPRAEDPAESGNLLAVFAEGGDLTPAQMQQIAHDLRPPGRYLENFSETVFVTDRSTDFYAVGIFTPREELPFAGHPTLGAAWTLRDRGQLKGDRAEQSSAAGVTEVTFEDERVWFRRVGRSHEDLRSTRTTVEASLAKAFSISEREIGLEPRELGRGLNRLRPAESDVGLTHLMVPVENLEVLGRCRPDAAAISALGFVGGYCFTAVGAGRVRARGFFPGLGIGEDPATGSAAACLGLYLAQRLGAIELEVAQGVEMGRPSRIFVKAQKNEVLIGGRCEPVVEGRLTSVP